MKHLDFIINWYTDTRKKVKDLKRPLLVHSLDKSFQVF
jgi:hypothetical protein